MKYFSLAFNLQKIDYDFYYKDFRKALILNQLKRSLFTLIFVFVMFMLLITSELSTLMVTLIFILIVTVFIPLVYSRKLSLSLIESRNSKKENRYDFYADHIEIHISADETSKSTAEKHLKMNGFTTVAESRTNFYFSYMNEKMLIIPKRVLDEEKYGMIKNLIDNYFSSVYMKL